MVNISKMPGEYEDYVEYPFYNSDSPIIKKYLRRWGHKLNNMTAFTMNKKWLDATWYGTKFSKTRRGYPDTRGWNMPCYDDADPDGEYDVPTDAEIMAKAQISSLVDKGLSAAQHAHSKMTMPFTPAGAWKHVTEVLKLDLPKEETRMTVFAAALSLTTYRSFLTSLSTTTCF